MSIGLALLLTILSVAVVLRLATHRVTLVLLLLLLGLLGIAGAEPSAWLPLAGLGIGLLWQPKMPVVRPKAKPKKQPSVTQTLVGGPAGLENKYELLEKVGVGGMASVYKAKSKSEGRIVALKIPQEKFIGDPRFVRRFHREAEVLSHLDHPNIVKVFDHGNEGDTHYIAMEFLEGDGLDKMIETRKLAANTVVDIMRRVAEALRHIHAQGIIHRDIKPGNIMILRKSIRDDGSVDNRGVRLMDFGIAAGRVLTRLTITGARIGTPVYMSPEQAKGQRIDYKSDIYSLGIVFYEALLGQPPFQGGYEAVIHQQMFQLPTPPKQLNPDVPQALSDLVVRMLDKDPEKRPNLDQVIDLLGSDWEEEVGLKLPVYVAVAVDAKKGSLRLLEPSGTLVRMWSGVGNSKGFFPSAPLSLSVDDGSGFWISLFEYGSSGVRLVHRFDAEGELSVSAGPYGLKPGEFLYPISVATAQDKLYVLDGETNNITVLNLKGEVQGRFGGAGPGRGLFEAPKILLATSSFLYVLDYGNRQVQRLTLEGQYLTRYAFRKTPESSELRTLGGIGLGIGEQLLIYDADAQRIRLVGPSGQVAASFNLPILEGEDPTSLVEMITVGEVLYAVRRGASRIHRIKLSNGEALAPLDIYSPVRALARWRNLSIPHNATQVDVKVG